MPKRAFECGPQARRTRALGDRGDGDREAGEGRIGEGEHAPPSHRGGESPRAKAFEGELSERLPPGRLTPCTTSTTMVHGGRPRAPRNGSAACPHGQPNGHSLSLKLAA